jgi:hypothetical protein
MEVFSLRHLAPQVILPSKLGRCGIFADAAVGVPSGFTVSRDVEQNAPSSVLTLPN